MNSIDADVIWLLSCGFLVVLMQAGFTALESGLVRAKNSINVAIKNLVDFCLSATLYGAVGFGLMFGPTLGGWVGTFYNGLPVDDPKQMAFFFFQVTFCGTATTLLSGAVAERMRFTGYFITAGLIAGLIYPIVGHWVWNGLVQGTPQGLLGNLGFIDFAGATVVHSVGGWVGLAALLIIGPRQGRFGPRGRPIEGHSLPLAVLGVFLIWFGWFGFNGGSTLGLSAKIPIIIINTALAGTSGGLAAYFCAQWLYGRPVVDRIMNGCLAGLVTITASAPLMPPLTASLIGAIGGLVCVAGMRQLERWQIDDAVGAVPTHLFAGIWGTLALALLAPAGAWNTGLSRFEQFAVQLLGVVLVGAFAFGVSFLVLRTLHRFYSLRVSPEDERLGLNIAEHGASTALLTLIAQMEAQAQRRNFSRPVAVEPETEAGLIATFYNQVLRQFNREIQARQESERALNYLAHHDSLTGLINRRRFSQLLSQALAQASSRGGGAVIYLDLDGFKAVNDRFGHHRGDQLLIEVAHRIQGIIADLHEGSTVAARLGGDEFALLLRGTDPLPLAEELLKALNSTYPVDTTEVTVGVSLGIAVFEDAHGDTADLLLAKADHAMYNAKAKGKGCYQFWSATAEESPSSPAL
ncbi:MAG: ammonium transporter [Candidatus Competibacterales bacterium]